MTYKPLQPRRAWPPAPCRPRRAIAAKQPPAGQTRAIERAVHRSSLLKAVPRERYRIVGERVSTVSRFWAYAKVRPRRRFQDTVDPADVVLVRPADSRRWVAVDLGRAFVGCGLAPDSVIADLRGVPVSEVCPPGEGLGS